MTELRGAGGTEGGLGTFFLGFVMAVAGGLLADECAAQRASGGDRIGVE